MEREGLPHVYVANVHIPGYVPESDMPGFETPREAWGYLAHERERDCETAEVDPQEDDSYLDLRRLADGGSRRDGRLITGHVDGGDAAGWVRGDTPGREGDHDLGLIYEVSEVPHDDYPHHAGYHQTCPACEARCHCAPGDAECVYGGDHD